ncbi:NAD-dependent succinate-semialdehyde dehydrogenase [Phytoactinopolyspora halophila]|nr:NAD-dependent succinate-semialdehyde dehydrogenase [Phytoactinopolyspora halophila]
MEANYIAGEWRPGARDAIAVRNPADGSVLAELGYGTANDAVTAADAASDAFGDWAARPARERSDILVRVADLLAERAETIGPLLARETGKRLPEGIGEIRLSAEFFRWFAHEIRQPHGELLTPEAGARRQVALSRPAGVAACLTPWNFPVSIQARKLAAALAAGCTTVSRASEKAPLAVVEMFRLLSEAGIPPGVANLVHGPAAEITDTLLDHAGVRVVSFTGSTTIGRQIMAKAAPRIVRPALELGGDAAFVVCADADVEQAVEGAMIAKFRNNGQSCIAANRFLVHRDVYEEFRDRLVAKVDAMTVGDPVADPVPDLGPLIDDGQVTAVDEILGEAAAAGARRLTRDIPVPDGGSYLAPSIWENVPDSSRMVSSEIFGPAAALIPFDTDDEAIQRANQTEMGLAGYVYTRDAARSWRYIDELDVGIVGCNNPVPPAVNAPLGGVKQSGLGREGGALGLEEFQVTRYASWQLV